MHHRGSDRNRNQLVGLVVTSPATTPDVTVAVRGALVRGLILAKLLKSRPSSAMAQITLGIGNMEPSKLVWERENKKHAVHIDAHS